IVYLRPNQLFDAGFMLSYAGVASIVYIEPVISDFLRPRYFKRSGGGKNIFEKLKEYVSKSVSITVAAWLGTMPLVASYFNIISPSAMLANLVAIPMLFFIMILAIFLAFTGQFGFLSAVSYCLAGSVGGALVILVDILRFVMGVPFSWVKISSPFFLSTLLFYLGILGLIVFYRKMKSKTLVIVFLLFSANIFLWNEVLKFPPQEITITFFDAGEADAAFIEFPDGRNMLIDGGLKDEKRKRDSGRTILANYFWKKGIRVIDCVVVTHPHADHLGGVLYVLENFRVNTAIVNGKYLRDPLRMGFCGDFLREVQKKKIALIEVKKGDLINGFSGMRFVVLNPSEKKFTNLNENSVVLKGITDKGNSVLFCGDIEQKAMTDMLKSKESFRADLVKVPHHGNGLGETSIMREFFCKTKAKDFVISNGDVKSIDKDLVEILKQLKASIYVTGFQGAVVIKERKGGFKLCKIFEINH
ncbi:MAG: ComEC/Rec2 family competence protein, partial [Candidatus Omnitrophica bacterium]|nr:ComEC/Rec2 family competence protein [Candidatus Omnitrophota bacterium]